MRHSKHKTQNRCFIQVEEIRAKNDFGIMYTSI